MAGRVVPYLDSPALYRWTKCALEALESRDVQALRTRLPLLLQASDERVLEALAPTCEANGVFSLVDAERPESEQEGAVEPHPAAMQAPEVEDLAEAFRTASLAPEVSEPTEALRTASQILTDSERAEAPPTLSQVPGVGTSAPEIAEGRGAGALCANQYGCQTSIDEALPGGSPPTPAPAAPGSTPSTSTLWRHAVEEDSWPWPAHGPAPALT
jgi:GntR family transcriptional regulator, transcriptional repressor for pyruvate dehydrogenase complex